MNHGKMFTKYSQTSFNGIINSVSATEGAYFWEGFISEPTRAGNSQFELDDNPNKGKTPEFENIYLRFAIDQI